MPTKHLKFGGSTIARTIACPGWVAQSEGIPKSAGSSFAHEGTLLHNCMEEYYTPGCEKFFDDMIGTEYQGITLTQEHVIEKLEPAKAAVESVLDQFDVAEEDIMLEPFVELIEDEAGGSIDMLAVSSDGKTVLVLDYKFGFNPVSAEDNKQLLFYALCASVDPVTIALFDSAEQIAVAIVQPKQTADESALDLQVYNMATLDTFENQAYDAIDAANADDAKDNLKTGEHCQYCPANATCPIKTGLVQKALLLPADHVETLNEAMAVVAEVEAWVKAVKKLAHEQMEQGVTIKGFKLVAKRASRVWNDTEAVEKKIRFAKKLKLEDTHEIKLMSPAKVEKVCKLKAFDFTKLSTYISSVSSGTTIAKESDKRPSIMAPGRLDVLAERLGQK